MNKEKMDRFLKQFASEFWVATQEAFTADGRGALLVRFPTEPLDQLETDYIGLAEMDSWKQRIIEEPGMSPTQRTNAAKTVDNFIRLMKEYDPRTEGVLLVIFTHASRKRDDYQSVVVSVDDWHYSPDVQTN